MLTLLIPWTVRKIRSGEEVDIQLKGLSAVITSFFLVLIYVSYGFGELPEPVIVVLGGSQATVGATLRLWGEESYSPTGFQITRYEWSVAQPPGSSGTFSPTSLTANPTFPIPVAGTYIFHLHVWNEQGVKSTVPATYSVNVIVYDNYQTVGPDVNPQITLGTTGQNMIVQNAGDGGFTQDVNGAGSHDWLEQHGGAGNDDQNAIAGAGNDYVFQEGGDGNDIMAISCGTGTDWIVQYGGAGDDSIHSNSSDGDDLVVVFGQAGNDTINVDGGAGNDTVRVFGGPGNDIVDYLVSDGQDDVLIDGGSGYDALTIRAGDNTLKVLDQQGNVIYSSGEGRSVIRVKCIEHMTVLGPGGGTLFDSDLVSPSFTLTVEKSGTGLGAVSSSPSGIDCGANCTKTCECGEEVTLIATSNPGSTFWGWWGGGCRDVAPCVVTMDANKTVEGVFELASVPSLTTNVNIPWGGMLMPYCSMGCWHNSGDKVSVLALAFNDYVFDSWSGDCCGSNPSLSFKMTGPMNCIANFSPCSDFPVRTDSTGYSSMGEAYRGANDNDVIRILGRDFYESLLLDRPIGVTLKAGYSCGYGTNPSMSLVKGPVTISKGTVIVENLMIVNAPAASRIPQLPPSSVFDYVKIDDARGQPGDLTQIELGTEGKDLIVEYGGIGNATQYATGADGGDWLLQVGGMGILPKRFMVAPETTLFTSMQALVIPAW